MRAQHWIASLSMVLAIGCGSGDTEDAEGADTASAQSSENDVSDVESDVGDSTSETSDATSTTEETSTEETGDETTEDSETTGVDPGCPDDPMSALPSMWDDGTACGSTADFQVHAWNTDTYIIRQSLCTNFEGPFLYLLFGEDKVLLEDTGAGGVDVLAVVDSVIDQWLADHGRTNIELVVVNSHAHGDHVQGNGQFASRPDTEVVGTGVSAVSSFFGISAWPDEIVQYDLGNRIVDVIPIPGHESSHLALFDRGAGLLLTGDTLYPGRLYISDFDTYVESIQRLDDHITDEDVCAVLGTHIEMTQVPGQDFPFGSTMHPDEHTLLLEREHVSELRQAVEDMQGAPAIEPHDDFIVYPL